MSASELDSRNIAVSMRKSVENLVISSQDAIGQSISQALNFSGVISQHTNQIIHEAKSVSRSPSPALRADSSGTEHTDNDKNESSLLAGSERHSYDNVSLASVADISLNVPKAASPNASGRVSEPRAAKKKSWYNALYPTYKSKSDDFKRLFKDLPDDERLIIDYSCAHQKEILVHGRLYASQNYLCFYASIFGWERSMSLRWKDVTAITKEKTALVIPNAIVVCTESEKNFLTSFPKRDKAYLMLFRIWQNALMEQPMSTQEFWQWVHSSYGEELGFNSDDEEYARELSDDTALASLPTILHIEDGAESSSMEAGGDEPRTPRTPRPHSGRDSSPPLVSNGGDRGGRVAGAGDDADTLPTDMSDTSDSEHDKHNGGQSEKCISEHTDMKQFIRIQLPFNVDQLFTMLFTNSKFNLELLAIRSISNYQQTSWQEKEGLKVREVSYKLALTAGPVGPKEVHVAETQTMNKFSKPGHLYSIECSSMNSGVPYADHFSVDVHYCLERVTDNATDMSLYGKVTYKKSVWGMVKTFLEKNAITGIDEYARLLASRLQLEAQAHAAPHKRKGRRARLRPALLEPAGAGAPLGPALTAAGAAGGAVAGPAPAPRWLLLLLLILFILNAVLYWRLYRTQHAIDIDDLQSRSNNLIFDVDRMSTLSGSQMSEWGSLLEAHSAKQRGQLLAWRDALDRAVSHLAQTEQALMKLLDTIKPTLEKARQDAEDQHTEL